MKLFGGYLFRGRFKNKIGNRIKTLLREKHFVKFEFPRFPILCKEKNPRFKVGTKNFEAIKLVTKFG
ncbi:MAG: hypothetical protein DWQ06_01355 [Calditrichaeota bacterium]|nr:MAG: hypothetical protein DWQ06_01355 [Calditrichota bacterium]